MGGLSPVNNPFQGKESCYFSELLRSDPVYCLDTGDADYCSSETMMRFRPPDLAA